MSFTRSAEEALQQLCHNLTAAHETQHAILESILANEVSFTRSAEEALQQLCHNLTAAHETRHHRQLQGGH